MSWLDALGWFGSALLVFSLLQARMLRLRVLNTIACIILTVFNAMLAVWPMVGMNIVLALINVYFIVKMLRESPESGAYAVIEVPADSPYLQHFLHAHAADIATFFPAFSGQAQPGRVAYLIQRGDETAGVTVARDVGPGRVEIELDYVTERFRDIAPGKFMFGEAGPLARKGIRTALTPSAMVAPYYAKLGARAVGDRLELDIPEASQASR